MGFVENVNKLATDLTASMLSAIDTVYTNIASVLNVSGNIDSVNATAVIDAEIVSVATHINDVSTVAASIASVDYFANTYYIGAVEPTIVSHPSLTVGDLWYDTVALHVKEYNGIAFGATYNIAIASDALAFTNKFIDDISNTVGADHVHYKVRNASGTTIPINTVVTASGTQPGTDYVQVVPLTDPQTQIALGIVHTTLLNNGVGTVVNTGVHDNMNTSAWAVGTILYPNNAGGFTDVKPTSGRYQTCAVVLRQHATNGTMLVEFTNPTLIASTTQGGYVQLNNTLTSTSTTQALTAAQGKVLQDGKQATLVSNTNIKTIGGVTVLGSGDIPVQPVLVSGTNIKTLNGESLLGAGDLVLSAGGGGVRQTVQSASVDTSGFANFLSIGTGLNVNISATTTAIKIHSAGGAIGNDRSGTISADKTLLLPASSTMYIYETVATDSTCTSGYTTLAPIYQFGGTPAVTAGQFTFNIGEMKGYLGNGTTAPQVWITFTGEAVTNATNVTSVVSYALNGRHHADNIGLAYTSIYNVNHNIGCKQIKTIAELVCITSEFGWSVGDAQDVSANGANVQNNVGMSIANNVDSKSISILTGTLMQALNKTTRANVSISIANWRVRAFISRNW